MECFQGAGYSPDEKQVLMMCRKTGPIRSKHNLSTCIEIPSVPHAPDCFMELRVDQRVDSETGCSSKADVPTRGKRTGREVGSPLARTSFATRGPTLTKYWFSSSGVASGTTRLFDFFPAMIWRTLRKIAVGPISRTLLAMSCRVSWRMAERTRLLSSTNSGVLPETTRSLRRWAIRSRVISDTGGAEGLRTLIRFSGANRSRMGIRQLMRADHCSDTSGCEITKFQSTALRAAWKAGRFMRCSRLEEMYVGLRRDLGIDKLALIMLWSLYGQG